jgi:hypothetical protein
MADASAKPFVSYVLIQNEMSWRLTFGEPPQFLWWEDTCRQDRVVVDDSIVRVVSISCAQFNSNLKRKISINLTRHIRNLKPIWPQKFTKKKFILNFSFLKIKWRDHCQHVCVCVKKMGSIPPKQHFLLFVFYFSFCVCLVSWLLLLDRLGFLPKTCYVHYWRSTNVLIHHGLNI